MEQGEGLSRQGRENSEVFLENIGDLNADKNSESISQCDCRKYKQQQDRKP